MLSIDLRRTLAITVDMLRVARDPWWIISSAAVALHNVDEVDPADVDVLTSAADARRISTDMGIVADTGAASDVFRSAVFARWTVPALPVEIMADFQVFTVTGWIPIRPRTRVPVMVETRVVYVPDRHELSTMLRLFGRPKDTARALLLDAHQ